MLSRALIFPLGITPQECGLTASKVNAHKIVDNHEHLVREWVSQQYSAVLLVCHDDQQRTLSTIDYLQSRIPQAPIIVALEAIDNTWDLLQAGVQEVIEWSSINTLGNLIDSAVARKSYLNQQIDTSKIDALTRLGNRTLFHENLEKSLIVSRQQGRKLGLLFIDLDRFRIINETHGHRVGDEILVVCAQRIRECVRKSDLVSRIAGKTFAFSVDFDGEDSSLSNIARKICNAFREPIFINNLEVFMSISIGIDVASPEHSDSSQLMHNAEQALQKAKKDGRNGFRFYTQEATPDNMARATMESALHYALERRQLSIVYQPQVDLMNGKFIGAEALLRWEHPTLGHVSPAVFIPVLEETGLIEAFGEWVVQTACTQFSQWLKQETVNSNCKISINLSPRQFRQPDLAERIENILDSSQLPPKNLTLEITESMLMNHMEQSIEMLTYLRELGCSVAIDDFGTGYSSLAYLKKLPVDYLKIDRMFVKDIVADNSDAAIADSIISLAHNLGMSVIAEGVENSEALDVLNELGCDHYQGFYFSKPSPPEDIPELAKKCLPPSKLPNSFDGGNRRVNWTPATD